uniref:Fibronectin type-III domain-containing protein n=1 Tax=Gouania willdenowi TaxID=441366 RepID=A0A8C5DPE4_GOUWI
MCWFPTGQHEDSCSVFSKDQYVEVGSSTEVLCQTTCVNGRIFWTINNKAVSDSLSETINSTHAVLPLRNFSLHRATVNCHSRDTRHILGGATIWMYSKPRSISCVLHYEEGTGIGVPQLLTCTWEHLVYSSLKVNYTVLYSSESNNILVEICNSSVTNCTVKGFYSLKNIQLLVGEDFNITVRAKTAAWEAYSDSQELHPFHILKINPPQFEVAAFSDHLLVTWNRTRTTVKHHCQVRYRKVCYLLKMVKIRIDEALDSCTSYRVSVCWALDEAPWSAWSREKTVLTKLNRNHIRLRLWRKDVPSTCRGTFTHTIKQSTVKNDSMEADNSSTACSNNSTCDVSVSRGAHWLTLSVFHDQLLLTEDSVYVPAAEENLPQVTQIQSVTLDGIILVSWRAPNPPVGRYMIDWTHDGNQYNWKESADTNATLSDLVDRKPYNITVTPLFDNKTGLGTQALQVCSRVGEPGSVSINNVQAEDTSAFISWSTKAQDPCSGEVVTYTVFYEAREGLRLNVTVNHTQQEINLRSLSPSTQYSIHVVSTALTGMSRSTERVFKTKTGKRVIMSLSYYPQTLLTHFALGVNLTPGIYKYRPSECPRLVEPWTIHQEPPPPTSRHLKQKIERRTRGRHRLQEKHDTLCYTPS